MHIALCNDVDIPLSDTELCVPCTEYSGSGHNVGYLMTYLCVRREPASGYKRYLTYLCEIHESEPDIIIVKAPAEAEHIVVCCVHIL